MILVIQKNENILSKTKRLNEVITTMISSKVYKLF